MTKTTKESSQKRMPHKQRDRFAAIAKATGFPIERVIEEHGERAAIREFLAGMTRAESEFHAFADTEDVLMTLRRSADARSQPITPRR